MEQKKNIWKLILKIRESSYGNKNNNDFRIDGTKVGGTSLIEFKETQIYGINISFEDASELVSQVIPPRSIKPVGFANYSYRDNLKEDIINALHGVE